MVTDRKPWLIAAAVLLAVCGLVLAFFIRSPTAPSVSSVPAPAQETADMPRLQPSRGIAQPSLPSAGAIELRRSPPTRDESEWRYAQQRTFVDTFDAFVAAVPSLTAEQRQAILDIMADTQANLRIMQTDAHLSDAHQPDAEHEKRSKDVMDESMKIRLSMVQQIQGVLDRGQFQEWYRRFAPLIYRVSFVEMNVFAGPATELAREHNVAAEEAAERSRRQAEQRSLRDTLADNIEFYYENSLRCVANLMPTGHYDLACQQLANEHTDDWDDGNVVIRARAQTGIAHNTLAAQDACGRLCAR